MARGGACDGVRLRAPRVPASDSKWLADGRSLPGRTPGGLRRNPFLGQRVPRTEAAGGGEPSLCRGPGREGAESEGLRRGRGAGQICPSTERRQRVYRAVPPRSHSRADSWLQGVQAVEAGFRYRRTRMCGEHGSIVPSILVQARPLNSYPAPELEKSVVRFP